MKAILQEAIEEIANLPDEQKQNIKGKLYTMVHTRVQVFRKYYGENSRIQTEIIQNDINMVCMKATISIKHDGEWIVLGTGHAEEFRGQGMVNKTSALENCETSCIGRALASISLHGGEYASAFEVDNAINNKAEAPDTTTGYNIKDLSGNIKNNCATASDFLVQMRVEYQKCIQEEKSFKGLYLMNKQGIQEAYENLSDKDKEIKNGYEALMELGESA